MENPDNYASETLIKAESGEIKVTVLMDGRKNTQT